MCKKVCIIPARGGSKRIPKKNIKPFHGKPLIAYSIETAKQSKLFDRIIVSTDDEEIAKIAKKYGAEIPFMRPKELADDYSGTDQVIEHAIDWLKDRGKKYDYACTIYATAPLLQPKYLVEGYEKLKTSDAVYSFSVTSMPFPIQRTFKITEDGRCEMFFPKFYSTRSQDLEEAYQDAGQFYWQKLSKKSNEPIFGKDSIPIILPRYLVQDIDTLEDWERAEKLYEILNKNRFDEWNSLKKELDKRDKNYFVRERDIYFISIGQNIRYEIFGKNELFLRPVVVLKKLNNFLFIGIPLTSKNKNGNFYFNFQYKDKKNSTAIISQIRVFDTNRLLYKSGRMKREDFLFLKEKISRLLKLPLTKRGSCTPNNLEQQKHSIILPKNATNVKNIIIRADSSSTIGTGHIMRSLVLAKEFKDKRVIFATRNLSGNINHKIKEAGYEIEDLKTNSIEELIDLIEKYNAQMVVIDSYEIDEAYEKALKQKTGVTIMVLDDTYEKHHCDILLNHNIYADANRYKELVPKHCELRCGKEYTLLRDEFIEAKKNLSKLKVQYSTFNIFIAMGGADNKNLTIKILETLEKFKIQNSKFKINIVATKANKNLDQLKEYTISKNNITLHINTSKIAELMAKSDLAIVTPSVTLNEVFFMELPFIAIQTADNQHEMTRYLEKNGYPVLREFNSTLLVNKIKKYLINKLTLINFTDISLEEKEMVLKWRNHPEIKKWMYNQNKIDLNSHLKFIETLKNSQDKLYFLVKKGKEYIGVVDFTDIDYTKKSAYFGLYTNPYSKESGLGKKLVSISIDYALNILKVKLLKLEVFSVNKKAINLYKKFDFKECERKTVNNKEIICMELKL